MLPHLFSFELNRELMGSPVPIKDNNAAALMSFILKWRDQNVVAKREVDDSHVRRRHIYQDSVSAMEQMAKLRLGE